jgi:hypothetical protein
VATGGAADPALIGVQADVAAKQTALDQAVATHQQLQARAQCELDGTCGTGDAGQGTAYQSAAAAASAAAASVDAARTALDDARAAATEAEQRSFALAQTSLATDTAQLERLTADQDRLQGQFDAANEGSGGILLRLEALDRLSDRNSTLWAAKTMLSLLFLSVEMLPVLVKLLLNFGPPSAYDELAALRDRGDVEVEELQKQSRIEVAQAQEELLVMAEKERLDRQKAAILARRRTALAAAAAAQATPAPAPAAAPADAPGGDDALRALWDTGPIRLARSAARTVRTARRRPGIPA